MSKRRNKKKKVKQISEEDFKQFDFRPVRFELEPNADEMFLQAIDKLSPAEARRVLKDREGEGSRESVSKVERQQMRNLSIDLHGMTLAEAQERVQQEIEILLQGRHQIRLRIITGKGLHSGPQGGILAREIHEFVRLRFQDHIVSLMDSPAEAQIGGKPIRGHFDVIIDPARRR